MFAVCSVDIQVSDGHPHPQAETRLQRLVRCFSFISPSPPLSFVSGAWSHCGFAHSLSASVLFMCLRCRRGIVFYAVAGALGFSTVEVTRFGASLLAADAVSFSELNIMTLLCLIYCLHLFDLQYSVSSRDDQIVPQLAPFPSPVERGLHVCGVRGQRQRGRWGKHPGGARHCYR